MKVNQLVVSLVAPGGFIVAVIQWSRCLRGLVPGPGS